MKLVSTFGRMRGLWRAHYLGSEILFHYQLGEWEYAESLLVQLLKLLHQVAVDGGSWDNALLMWPTEDPVGQEDFGMEEHEMIAIHAYRRGLTDLKTKGMRLNTWVENDEDKSHNPGKDNKGKPGKGKPGKDNKGKPPLPPPADAPG